MSYEKISSSQRLHFCYKTGRSTFMNTKYFIYTLYYLTSHTHCEIGAPCYAVYFDGHCSMSRLFVKSELRFGKINLTLALAFCQKKCKGLQRTIVLKRVGTFLGERKLLEWVLPCPPPSNSKTLLVITVN